MSQHESRDGGARDPRLRGDERRDTTQPRERRVRGIPIRSDRLQALRHERGWTQVDAAKAVGVADRTFQSWEKTGGRVNAENLQRLINAFDTTWEHLTGEGQVQALPLPSVEERLAVLVEEIRQLATQVAELRAALGGLAASMAQQVTAQTERVELQPPGRELDGEEGPQRDRRHSPGRREDDLRSVG